MKNVSNELRVPAVPASSGFHFGGRKILPPISADNSVKWLCSLRVCECENNDVAWRFSVWVDSAHVEPDFGREEANINEL